MRQLFEIDPREYALDLVDQGILDPVTLLTATLKWMSTNEVRDMLVANEISPNLLDLDNDQVDLG